MLNSEYCLGPNSKAHKQCTKTRTTIPPPHTNNGIFARMILLLLKQTGISRTNEHEKKRTFCCFLSSKIRASQFERGDYIVCRTIGLFFPPSEKGNSCECNVHCTKCRNTVYSKKILFLKRMNFHTSPINGRKMKRCDSMTPRDSSVVSCIFFPFLLHCSNRTFVNVNCLSLFFLFFPEKMKDP